MLTNRRLKKRSKQLKIRNRIRLNLTIPLPTESNSDHVAPVIEHCLPPRLRFRLAVILPLAEFGGCFYLKLPSSGNASYDSSSESEVRLGVWRGNEKKE